MENQFRKASGICLLIGSVLATLTMVLHPLGGSLAEIVRAKFVAMVSHSLAILCIPFMAFGFWGLSTALATKSRLSFLGFSMACFALVAVLIAGSINGLVLPQFASAFWDSSIDASLLKVTINYGSFINLAMDYIFIVFIALSILTWSLLIVTTSLLSRWLGYYGILIVLVVTTCILLKLNFTSVFGFSLFIFGMVSWKVLAGVLLILSGKKVQI